MHQISEDLWQSSRYSSGGLSTHAYLLTKEEGNVLFYNTSGSADLDHIEQLGGVAYQLLTHRDESGASLKRIQQRFQSHLGCSLLEAPYIEKDCLPDCIFSATCTHLNDIQILQTPGHTNGSISYFYSSPTGLAYLFTGDTFFQWHGEWTTFILESAGGTYPDMINSLRVLRDITPDFVFSSGFVGDIAYREVTEESWRAAIDQEICKLNSH